jgi:TonB family protein
MARIPLIHVPSTRAFTLLVGCVLWALPAAAQSAAPADDLMMLDPQAAGKLIVKQETPEYPPLAKLNYIQGPVSVEVLVTRDGHVGEAHVIRGHPFLAIAVLNAIRHWLYRPAKARPKIPEFLTVVDVHFALHNHALRPFPPKPEEDLQRQVHPPEVLEGPQEAGSRASVRMRLLVGPEGRVQDARPVGGDPAFFNEARQAVAHWTFRPARWGALAVPWYLDVDVPVGGRHTVRCAAAPANR